jgi:threonine dehydrogenase-like Zn-dependent dehydrogenase
MKAIAVFPHQPNSAHIANLPEPRLDEIAEGRGALVRVLRVGVDGTDREIQSGEYGEAPEGFDFLVEGHESLGRVDSVGPNVRGLSTGDLVVATVRRPGSSLYDRIGYQDFTTDDVYYERGISRLHGFLTERYVEDVAYLVRVPEPLASVGVLLEPLSVVEKGIAQAYEIQRRLHLWRPERAAVTGAGSVGLLATFALRLRDLEVTVFSRNPTSDPRAKLVEAAGGRYVEARNTTLVDVAAKHGPFDIIVEATGYSPIAFDAMEAVAKNGVAVLASITGGDRKTEVATDRINQGFVLGNKVAVGTVNASRADFEQGVTDMARAAVAFPGWLERLLTHRVQGLECYGELFERLAGGKDIKVYLEVSA